MFFIVAGKGIFYQLFIWFWCKDTDDWHNDKAQQHGYGTTVDWGLDNLRESWPEEDVCHHEN